MDAYSKICDKFPVDDYIETSKESIDSLNYVKDTHESLIKST